MASPTVPASNEYEDESDIPTATGPTTDHEVFELLPRPASRREYVRSMIEHIPVIRVMARKDFHVRYKRANLGVIWAVVLPIIQAAVLITIFSRVLAARGSRIEFGPMVLGGIIPYTFFNSTVSSTATSVVDGSTLAAKIWFPRSILVLVPALANLVTLGIGIVILLVATPLVNGEFSRWSLLYFAGPILLVAFTVSLGLCLSALHVYFRDTKFMVQAVLMVTFYVTPIIYPKARAGKFGDFLDFNPLTGVVSLFQSAIGGAGPELRPVIVSVVVTLVLLVIGFEAHRRHDRLFVDLL